MTWVLVQNLRASDNMKKPGRWSTSRVVRIWTLVHRRWTAIQQS